MVLVIVVLMIMLFDDQCASSVQITLMVLLILISLIIVMGNIIERVPLSFRYFVITALPAVDAIVWDSVPVGRCETGNGYIHFLIAWH